MSTSIWNHSRHSGNRRNAVKNGSNPGVSWIEHLSSSWIEDMRRCLHDSGVEEVHKVRTGTRRLEAQLEFLIDRVKPLPGSWKDSLEPWMRQMKKIRRAAGAVRDLDVHRKLMERFTGVGKSGRKLHEEGKQGELERNIPSPEEKTLLEQQAGSLDNWLRNERDRHAKRLEQQIEKRLPKIEGLSQSFLLEYARRRERAESREEPAVIALESFAKLCGEMPLLNAANLHEFRKRAKKARYLTESPRQSARDKKVGARIKEIQDAIGDWHDWLALSEEAKIALKDQSADLVKRLEEHVASSYQEALDTTEKLKMRLLGGDSKVIQAKKPAGRVSAKATANGHVGKRA